MWEESDSCFSTDADAHPDCFTRGKLLENHPGGRSPMRPADHPGVNSRAPLSTRGKNTAGAVEEVVDVFSNLIFLFFLHAGFSNSLGRSIKRKLTDQFASGCAPL